MTQPRWIPLVRRQAGLATRGQLLAAGITDKRIAGWKRRGVVVVEGDGLYRLTVVPAAPDQTLWRAQLLTGGVLTGAAALYVWGTFDEVPPRPMVVVDQRQHLDPVRGVRIRRRTLEPSEVSRRHGLLVTTRGYSALEHIAELPFSDAVPFADRALAQKWFSERDVEKRLAAPLTGNRAIRRVLAVVERGVESEAERRMVRLLRQAGITGWKPNQHLSHRGEFLGKVDIVFESAWLVIEVNGFEYHSRRTRFRSDMRRNNRFEFTPYMVLEFGWDDIVSRPDAVIAEIRRALAARLAA